MSLYICYNVYLPMRAAPSHKAEMTSEVLFGERFEVIENSGNWHRIITAFDSESGWIDGTQTISAEWLPHENGIITGKELLCIKPDKTSVALAPGSEIFDIDLKTGTFPSSGDKWMLSATSLNEVLSPDNTPLDSAKQYLNAPYLWGGRTPWGIDCSGLVQTVYKIHGISLPRNSNKQADCGQTVDFLEESLPGDLLFFSGDNDIISHVGMLYSAGKVIHSSGSVKIDPVDHQGIWSDFRGIYTHRLRIIKRITQ